MLALAEGIGTMSDELLNLLLNVGTLLLFGVGGPKVSQMLGDRIKESVTEATAEIVSEMEKLRTDAATITVRQDMTDTKVDEIHDVVVNQILPIVSDSADTSNGERNPNG